MYNKTVVLLNSQEIVQRWKIHVHLAMYDVHNGLNSHEFDERQTMSV